MNNEKKAPVRQIKFRGLRVDGEGWLFGDLSHVNEQILICPKWEYPNQWDDIDMNVFPESVGQFTGVYDSDNKEIFEHDIVTFGTSGHKYKVVYKGDGFIAISDDGDKYGPYTHRLNPINLYNRESLPKVIGNIHEESEVTNG